MDALALIAVSSAAFVVNIGAGRLRAASPRFSLLWFLYIHLPVLAIVPLRFWFGLDVWTIPLLVIISVLGQVIGGRMTFNS